MDFFTAVGAAITFGSALGATVAALFATRQKSLVTLLRESNNDYKDRVEQLEDQRVTDRDVIEKLKKEVAQLKREKALPLQRLEKLVMTNHQQTLEILSVLTKAVEVKGKKK